MPEQIDRTDPTDSTDPTVLDRYIAAWASDIRLVSSDVDLIRRQILAAPRPGHADGDIAHPPAAGQQGPPPPATAPARLPAEWWQTFTLQVADVIVGAQRRPATASPLVLLG